jgi:hypothetical protein
MTIERLTAPEDRLIDALAAAERGPKRNGVFAVWLVLRQWGGALPPTAVSADVHRRRLANLERRLASLSVAAPVRRALSAALRELRNGTARDAPVALRQLVAPAREALGADVADALAEAARLAREAAEHRA